MVVVYPNLGNSYSMNRYADGLVNELNRQGIAYKLAITKQYKSRTYRLFQKYIWYPVVACLLRNNERHIIVSERFAYLTLFLPKEKTVTICHDLHTLYTEERNSLLQKVLYRWQVSLLKARSKVAVISEHTATDLVRFFPTFKKEELNIVANGLEDHWFVKPQGVPLIDEENPFILTVGTDAWYKNFKKVINVLELLPSEYRLIKVGHIKEDHLKLIKEKKLESRIIQKEQITDSSLKALYHSAHCLIFPSLSEGFGWPSVEAMACGCPVVTSGKGSVSEVCGDAVLYASTDVEYLEQINSLFNAEIRAEYIYKGRQQAKKYSWKYTVDSLLKM